MCNKSAPTSAFIYMSVHLFVCCVALQPTVLELFILWDLILRVCANIRFPIQPIGTPLFSKQSKPLKPLSQIEGVVKLSFPQRKECVWGWGVYFEVQMFLSHALLSEALGCVGNMV